MYADEAFADDAELLMGLDLADDMTFTPLDPEFQHVIADPKLAAELAAVREARPEPTTALLDGSARARRDRRVAQRVLGNAVRMLRVDAALPVATDGEAA